ncbi:MAG: CDGSH iron-sulfur domain-containing protein [Chloroflexi bacterium]|nr:CDGSH iron-sulfur domain-containing protein [Chloroflexota bacterium]
MAASIIVPLANGPYLVTGPIKLLDPEGREFTVQGDKIALCRCGGSSNKPFCDGTHKRTAFKAETKAS